MRSAHTTLPSFDIRGTLSLKGPSQQKKKEIRELVLLFYCTILFSLFFCPIELWRLQSNVESSINLFSFDWQVVIGGSIVDLVAAVQEDSIQVSAFLNYFLSKRMARDQTRAHTHTQSFDLFISSHPSMQNWTSRSPRKNGLFKYRTFIYNNDEYNMYRKLMAISTQ